MEAAKVGNADSYGILTDHDQVSSFRLPSMQSPVKDNASERKLRTQRHQVKPASMPALACYVRRSTFCDGYGFCWTCFVGIVAVSKNNLSRR